MSDLSPEDVEQAVSVLSRLQPGVLPFAIFHQLARLSVMPIIEIVPLRYNDDTKIIEVILLPRPSDDPIWPGQLHVPGTVIRASDEPGNFSSAFERIISGELGIANGKPQFVCNILHHSGRGMEASQVFWIELTDKPAKGTFYKIHDLPTNIVASQLDFLEDVFTAFKRAKNV